MQKSANRCTSTGKVTKKTTKKMGTPSPPAKKKKTPEAGGGKQDEATTSTSTARSKSPVKRKPTVVAKKPRKDLKPPATPKKKVPKKPAVKRAPAKKVVRAKAKTKQEIKATPGDTPKGKRKPTAKNKATNSKLTKKDATVSALPLTSETPTTTGKKSGTAKATDQKSRAKGRVATARANKQKTMKKEVASKVVQPVSPAAGPEVSSQVDTAEPTPLGDVGPLNKLERRDTLDSDRKSSKKDDKKEDSTDKKQTEEINCKETIAKLLKKANKSITPKRKRDLMKIKSTTTIVKKAKVVRKPKKPQIHAVKVEPEEVKDQEAIDAKKVTKKPAKPKKKPNVKEEKVELKEESKDGEQADKQAENVADEGVKKEEEEEQNTDDSTTSDEMTLNLLKHSSDQATCSKMADDKSSKGKKIAKVKSEPSSESDHKYKPLKQVKRKASPKVLQDKKKKMMLLKKAAAAAAKDKPRSDSDQKSRKLKLYSWWTGPKRHRVASLNALAKVHCLYENESRGALYDVIKRSPAAKESNSDDPEHEPSVEPTVEASTRTLRSVPGLRGVAGGGYWEMHDDTSSSSSSSAVSSSEENSNDDSVDGKAKLLTPPPSYKQKQQEKKQAAAAAAVVEEDAEVKEKVVKAPRKRRNRTELMMDLKDMVVRKRMASLNASAMLAASYSVEKKPLHCVQTSDSSDTDDGSDASVMTDVLSSDREPSKRQCYETDVNVKKEEKLIEVRASPNKKVAVILNQDTDVTITGVYVNSTTRSTHHEGYCSIAGMQYRISATSHTQTAATAVATETLLHSEHGTGGEQSVPCKSYTPLGALSSMQPPGSHVPPPQPPPHSPTGRRHGCPSAFTAPPTYGPPPPHHHHHPPPPGAPGPDQPPVPPPPTYMHGYYQPAGPLITAHHGHSHPPPPLPVPAGKVVAVAAASLEASPSPTPPPPPPPPPTITTHQPPPSSTGTAESSDNEVIITSASSGGGGAGSEPVPVALPLPAHTYRYTTSGQYPPPPAPPPPGYTYSAAAAAAAAAYPPSQYYHHAPPPATYAQQQQQQQHFHHDICYPSAAGYAASYIHPKTYTTFRRYLPAPPPPAGPQYYQTNADLYPAPPPSNATSSQVVSAGPSGAGGSSYQQQQQPPPPTATLVESYVPPSAPGPPTIVEPYPPPPPPHYYTGYSTGPAPPACYTHSPPTRNLAFIDAAYQSCPCPMQSCPKNVHTGPLTGDGKRSSVIAKESSGVPLPPVALALPLEPASVAGPPSPARGSAGMPPPPSPAGATYQPTPITNNSSSNSNSSNNSTTGVPILTPKWEDDQVLLMDKPTSTECTTTATTQVLLTSTISNNNTTTSTSSTAADKRNKMARVGKQMARNNIMLLMCHNTAAAHTANSNTGDNPVKREVESPEETKTLVQSIAVPSTPPPTPTPSPMLLVSETKQESPETMAAKILKSEQPTPVQDVKQSLKNETYYEEEQLCVPQVRVMRRHSTQQQHPQQQQQQQCKVVNNSRRKSLQVTQTHDVTLKHEESAAVPERAGLKRKHSLTDTHTTAAATDNTDDECKTQVKKQKPSIKSKSTTATGANGSYKDLIKRDKCAQVASTDVKPPERKFLLYKTPKIMLGRAKKTVKRKTTVTKQDEPTSKRLKTSRPLVASNLHNSKQNKQQQQQQLLQSCEAAAEKKPCPRKAQVNSKVHRVSVTGSTSGSGGSCLSNVDRTIECVVSQCGSSEAHTVTTSTEVVLRTSNSAAAAPGGVVQARGVGSGRSGASKRKNKSSTMVAAAAVPIVAVPAAAAASPVSRGPRKSLHMPRWSNGWSWDGAPFQGKVFLNSDEALVVRRCYPAMRHTEGDIIAPRDCVLLKAGPRKIDLPFVAKVAALWEDDDGEMMMSLLWYYRPEHTDQGRRPADRPDEVFASRHKDTNSVACIEDKCYVLTYNEYCRYRKSVRRLEEGLEHTGQVVPMPEGGTYHRQHRQPPAPLHTAPELVFFCRQVYDFRQKRLMKNPS